MLKLGLYEQVISRLLRKELASETDKHIETAPIDKEEASRILAKYSAQFIEMSLEKIKDNGGSILSQVELINRLLDTVSNEITGSTSNSFSIDERPELLLALLLKKNNIYSLDEKATVVRPESSISQSSMFTGAGNEPSMFTELKKEIMSCDKIDMLVSFIKWSGLRLIIDELQSFTLNGGHLRVITTSYMGATDAKAISVMSRLPNTQIKISYDTKRTRLHAKTYVFHRYTGFSTAYVGSSNLSNAAISSGLEWNVKITAKDQPDTMKKIDATFESYWNAPEFETYSESESRRLERALKAERYNGTEDQEQYMFDIIPFGYQQEILEKLKAERELHSRFKNLIVAATGTGKTVISAFDYKRFREENSGKPNRLLFVAHREEILKQSLGCFRGVLRDPNFGELFVGEHRPEKLENLFLSIQTFNSQEMYDKTTPDFFDYIIIDEFHHAAAATYQKLLSYYKPKILLGLTATPERMDGKSVYDYFDTKFPTAEIRLPEAIERKLLSSFQYFGVSDSVDLNDLKWSRGGYDLSELSKLYTDHNGPALTRANLIIKSVLKYVTDIDEVKGLAFCASVEHAKFMAEHFNKNGIESFHLTGQSTAEERNTAKSRLLNGSIRFIFVVDIYNEGVDIPEINTILFLRPTQSLTIFLQQLGRGLRITRDKECLTVLDFIGQANNRYNFEDKFASLLTKASKGVMHEFKNGFANVPKGCYIQLERKAREHILDNIRRSIGMKAGMISRISTFEVDTGLPVTLENFVENYHLDVGSIYKISSFSRLCVLAGVKDDFEEPNESVLAKAFRRICAIDSRKWLNFLLKTLPIAETIDIEELNEPEKRMLQMFQFTVWQKSHTECGFSSLKDGLVKIRKSGVLYSELIDLLYLRLAEIDFVDEHVPLGFECPLDLHCNYTRDQVLVAMDFMKPTNVREGVKYLPDKKLDIFFVTLNKSDKDYSPSTLYDDYSINDMLFHWQSQSTTSESSSTGQRYINHGKMESSILLFVRENKNDILGASPYTFLGLVDYVEHEGSNPMNIVWRLRKPIPAKYLKTTNKLVMA